MRGDRERIEDMLEAIGRIERHVKGREAFVADDVAQVWVVHHLEILGEAARGISDALRVSHPEVPWSKIVATRAVLAHQYFRIEALTVWRTVEKDLPPLRRQLEAVAHELAATPPSSAP